MLSRRSSASKKTYGYQDIGNVRTKIFVKGMFSKLCLRNEGLETTRKGTKLLHCEFN